MGSYFDLYNVARSGMLVNQAGLAATSNNITNINTKGFSRQRMVSAENVNPQMGRSGLGKGVRLEEINQLRNQFLDHTYWRQNANAGYWQQKSATLEQMEQTLSDFVSGNDGVKKMGLQQCMQNFANGWYELKKHPDSRSARSSLTGFGSALIESFNHIDQQLAQMQQDASQRLKDMVDKLNAMAQKVAQCNTAIQQAELEGVQACELRDQRNLLLDEISGITDIKVSEQTNGLLSVSIGGVPLVCGGQARKLQVVTDGTSEHPLKVQWDNNEEVSLNKGSMLAAIEAAEQNGLASLDAVNTPLNFKPGEYNSISDLRKGLNCLLMSMVSRINESHKAGFGLDGSTGIDFFVPASSGKPLSISNLKLNPLLDDPNKIAAAASANDLPGGSQNAETIYKVLTEEKSVSYDSTPMSLPAFYQAIVSWVGEAGKLAGGVAETQDKLVQQIDNQRQSVFAVSMDEETAAMIKYQRIYSANAKVLNTIDNLLGELIHDLG